LHDIGKVPTRDRGFDGHDRIGAELADAWMKRWRFSNEERTRVVHAVRHHLIDGDEHTHDATLRRVLQRVTPAALGDVMTLARADIEALGVNVAGERARLTALGVRLDAMVAAGVALTTRDLAIDGATLMRELAMKPSKQLGETLTWLVERVLDDPNHNTREGLLALARERISPPHA
jgi:tRNA nucleotidyltransferase (CCA-adding enzyme)